MKLDEHTLEYLKGKKFSNSLTIQYDYRQSIPDRVRLLVDLSRGKRILHLGCLDHLPLIDAKIPKGQWLHKELTEVAAHCLGVDINREAMDYVKKQYGFDNIIERDITGPVIPDIVNSKWDFVILGELLEHVDNPVSYLAEIREKYQSVVDKMIITVPNVLTKRSLRAAAQSAEIINSDHRYWFTPYTIGKVMFQAGIELDEILFANRIRLGLTALAKNKLLGWAGIKPAYGFDYAYSIVAIGKLS